jgi:tyrosyl-tRNA synthetase
MTTAEDRIALIERHLDEVLTHEDLAEMVRQGEPLRHYIGFEISGRIHLGTGLMSMLKVKDFMDAGVACNVLLADWHTWINDKLGGDIEVIRRVAVRYFQEGLSASLAAIGGDPAKLNFVLGTDLYRQNVGFWETLVDVSKNVTLARVVRSVSIMGREAGEGIDLPAAPGRRYFLPGNQPGARRHGPAQGARDCARRGPQVSHLAAALAVG